MVWIHLGQIAKRMMQLLMLKVERIDEASQYNYGDWFLFLDYILNEIYGFPQAPYQLPIFVSPKLAFL